MQANQTEIRDTAERKLKRVGRKRGRIGQCEAMPTSGDIQLPQIRLFVTDNSTFSFEIVAVGPRRRITFNTKSPKCH